MRRNLITFLIAITGMAGLLTPVAAQGPNSPKTNSRILYHDGPVRTGPQNLYFIFYGNWVGNETAIQLVTEFAATAGNSPYLWINSTYTDVNGTQVSPHAVYAGSVLDESYSHGTDFTETDVRGVIEDAFLNFQLPQDPQGIYVLVASWDISSNATGYCQLNAPPFHGHGIINGGDTQYIFLIDPRRCTARAGGQYFPHVGNDFLTPNGNFSGDAMVLNLAHALNGTLTDPHGNGWFDRYGFENADKCTGTFGQVYTTANGAPANVHLGTRDFLLEQNWVNDRKGRCALAQ